MTNEEEFIPTRQSLLSRLRNWNDQESWKVFFDTYWKLIYTAAIKAELTDAEAQDVVQETVIAVCKAMPTFQYSEHGSFKCWLLRLTSWRINDQIRSRKAHLGLIGAAAAAMAGPLQSCLEKLWEEQWETNLLEAALARVKRKVDSKMFQVFDLYVYHGWAVSRVARALKVSRAYVY